MTYSIRVHDDFVAELNALPTTIKTQLRKKLDKIVENPHIPKNRLAGDLYGCYKIKLRKSGIRLVYAVNDDEIYILLLNVGKREKSLVYTTATNRLS